MKRPIPQLPSGDESLIRVLRALKENQEEHMGQRGGSLTLLEDAATTAEIIAAINAIIGKLQA